MFYKLNPFLLIIFYCNIFFSQSLSSPPHTVKDIFHSSQSLWVVGESDQNGEGVYKYENEKWYYFEINNAHKITATSSNIPAIINNEKQLLILKNNQWINIANNVKCFSGSYRTNQLWAVVNNELQFYQNNNWSTTNYNPMIIEEITEAGDGTLFTLNTSNYLFQLKRNNWEIVNSLKGEKISASMNSTLYLSQEIINVNNDNVKKYSQGNWTNLSLTAKKLVSNTQQSIYYIDGFDRLFEKNGNVSRQISNNPIVNNLSNGNNSYGSNPHEIDSTSGETSLFKAIRNNDINAMFNILSKGADLNKKNNNQETPLIVAIQVADSKLISSLIGLKPNLEHLDKNSKNALWYAVNKQDTANVMLLIKKEANPNALEYLSQIVDFTKADQKKTKLISIFLEAGVKITSQQIKKLIVLNHEQNYFQLINNPNKASISKDNYDQFLKEAIKVNNKKIAKNCIENGANPDLLMSFAMDQKDKSLILYLLSKNANPNSVIKYSIQVRDEDLLWNCIDNYGASKDVALKYSCDYNQLKYATTLLEKGANPNEPMKSMIEKMDTLFVGLLLGYNADGSNVDNFKSAIKTKSIEMVNLLLENGANHNDGIITAIEVQSTAIVSILIPKSKKENIQLIETACSRNNQEIIKLLLKNGSNPQNGLDVAIKGNKVENVNLLINKGARIDSDELLINAVKTKNLELVKVLVQNAISHVDTIINYGIDISAGIKYAVNQNSYEIVDYLLKNGADQSKSDEYYTIAAHKNYLATLKILIQNGLNPNVIDEEKNTLIHLCCIKNYFSITKELIETNKIDINAYNEDGMTALMYVVKVKRKRKDIKMCQLLVENGADVNARDDFGTIIRKMARGCSVKKYLKKNGAFKK